MKRSIHPHVRQEFLIVACLILMGHGLDLISTYAQNPSLDREVGFLYLRLKSVGLGTWPVLIGAKVGFAVMSIGTYGLLMCARRRFYPYRPSASWREFIYTTHMRDSLRDKTGRWMMPSPRLLLPWVVYIITIGAAAYAWVLALHNTVGSPDWLASTGRVIATLVALGGFWAAAWFEYRAGVGIPATSGRGVALVE
jgi:hypothetical protein